MSSLVLCSQIVELHEEAQAALAAQLEAAKQAEKEQMPTTSSEYAAHQLEERFVTTDRVVPSLEFEMRAVSVGSGWAFPCSYRLALYLTHV